MAAPLDMREELKNASDCSPPTWEGRTQARPINRKLDRKTENNAELLKGFWVEEFVYSKEEFILPGCEWQGFKWDGREKTTLSRFDWALQSKWKEKMRKGLFRYPLEKLQTCILPGSVQFVAQLNIQRGTERRKPQDIQSVGQRFDPQQFNFNKIKPEEILLQLSRASTRKEPGPNAHHEIQDSELVRSCCQSRELSPENQGELQTTENNKGWRSGTTLMVINVSPLEFGHILFIPDPALCLPQILTPDLIQLGIESVLLSAHRGFRVGFNSLGGFASVNHLHLHGFYLDQELLIESVCSEPLCPDINFHLLSDFPAPGFLFYSDGRDLEAVARNICKVTDYFVTKDIAHNVFVTRGSLPGDKADPKSCARIRIIIWARKSCFGAKEESAFNVALCELSGHLPIKTMEDFHNITEASAITIIQKYLLPDLEFLQLKSQLIALLTV
ncbi:GDP-D-glucose phosphorylase 1 [Rhinatrema bivittatum]|uniref:GDP-D-glucose phosphorylase 1 n=1 Tax=Rhinatrema bivittatum TaxID=194408 RepID=UPI00112AE99D|nr:GDP-D-glucose phosphorylase 1 [Rhinatrema bivittatum]XP_029430424.1 GDP-D-glucose phosphorylase 1 [Rhinatrema bivittatum]